MATEQNLAMINVLRNNRMYLVCGVAFIRSTSIAWVQRFYADVVCTTRSTGLSLFLVGFGDGLMSEQRQMNYISSGSQTLPQPPDATM